MIILYIDDERCTSLEQLQGYFKSQLSYDSIVFQDLLGLGRAGDIAGWLREHEENQLADAVDAIDCNIGDAEYIARLGAVMNNSDNSSFQRPAFEKCFDVTQVRVDDIERGKKVTVELTVRLSVNESYELKVKSNWGTKAVCITPYFHEEGKTMTEDFVFLKRPGVEFASPVLYIDGDKLEKDIVNNTNESTIKSQKLQKYLKLAKTIGKAFYMVLTNEIKVNVEGYEITMSRVEGGTFTMGATSEQGRDAYDSERPAHRVTLSAFYIGKFEVTQALWKTVMKSNPSNFVGANFPVEMISWNDCQEFIRKLNGITGKNFRLPTESEWEFAARGGNMTKGYKYSGSNNLDDVAWYDGNSGDGTHEVGMKHPNELGIYDMCGNVWEWCSDWQGKYNAGSQTNPKGPSSGSYRVFRGGSWYYNARNCRVSSRGGYSPDSRYFNLGLRLVLSE